ncbi:MAG TPA: SDR family NAD(P)-dependent oxidoreductase [Acidimicrobiia bacterium]|nr:SDR family NAD(P)-dependent oxidoreductase [Acidimicrobiia bacterium]
MTTGSGIATFDLTGRRAIVTGGGGGIGTGLAEGLLEAGASVAMIARSDAVDDAARHLGGQPAGVHAVRADLSDRDQLAAGFGRASELLGGIDILVNCHGTVTVSPAEDMPITDWDRVIEVNLTATFELCRLAGIRMLAQGSGKIVNIASMYAFFGGLKVVAYTASKAGVAQMTKALANEWAGRGVNVNAIAPGYVKTQMNRHVWGDPVRNSEIVGRLPAGRWGEPSDLKGPVVFLSSAASDYLHGVVLPVDGGYLGR